MRALNPYPEYKDSGTKWLASLPEHWQVKRLKHLAWVRLSGVDKKSHEDEIEVRLCNYLDAYKNDLITPDLDFMRATASQAEIVRFRLEKGDILITKDSEEWDDIAVPAYVTCDFNDVICGYHLALIKPKRDVSNGEYLFRSFSARGINDQFRVEATGVTRFGIGKDAIGNALFCLPPLDEQIAIARFLKRETAKIDHLLDGIPADISGSGQFVRLTSLLREYRSALISAAVTGKIDVRGEVA